MHTHARRWQKFCPLTTCVAARSGRIGQFLEHSVFSVEEKRAQVFQHDTNLLNSSLCLISN
jgi:hypothetical protein